MTWLPDGQIVFGLADGKVNEIHFSKQLINYKKKQFFFLKNSR
jgi:hypothetical protein